MEDLLALLTCEACKEPLRQPHTLPCSHRFCKNCLTNTSQCKVCHLGFFPNDPTRSALVENIQNILAQAKKPADTYDDQDGHSRDGAPRLSPTDESLATDDAARLELLERKLIADADLLIASSRGRCTYPSLEPLGSKAIVDSEEEEHDHVDEKILLPDTKRRRSSPGVADATGPTSAAAPTARAEVAPPPPLSVSMQPPPASSTTESAPQRRPRQTPPVPPPLAPPSTTASTTATTSQHPSPPPHAQRRPHADSTAEPPTYTCREDDTPRSLSQRFGVSMHAIIELNQRTYPGLSSCSRLRRGTVLCMPSLTLDHLPIALPPPPPPTLEAPGPLPRPGGGEPPILLGTQLEAEEQDMLKKLGRRLGARVVKSWSAEVTHVVCATRGTNRSATQRMCGRTFKYLMAMLHGQWIVSSEWLSACEGAGHWVDEAAYEAHGDHQTMDEATGEGTGGPRRARESKKRKAPALFAGATFYVDENFPERGLRRKEIMQLLSAGGASVAKRLPTSAAAARGLTVVVHEEVGESPELLEQCEVLNIDQRVHHKFLMDAISRYEWQ